MLFLSDVGRNAGIVTEIGKLLKGVIVIVLLAFTLGAAWGSFVLASTWVQRLAQ